MADIQDCAACAYPLQFTLCKDDPRSSMRPGLPLLTATTGRDAVDHPSSPPLLAHSVHMDLRALALAGPRPPVLTTAVHRGLGIACRDSLCSPCSASDDVISKIRLQSLLRLKSALREGEASHVKYHNINGKRS
ncbi:hypothetical protein IAQ61_002225 [Plenodomus lingam]|uniref:uncharacterized protein n=1 Tax=Leptosphaeria maculans TaxID=5022 RepID=UPI00331869DB|nr:hypothetical protein IAQ61_002225 [Plenodomus lingam]